MRLNRTHLFSIVNTRVPNTLTAYVNIYPSNLALLIEGFQSLIKVPRGCFEQTSATTYPLVMALQLIMQMPTTTNPLILSQLSTISAQIQYSLQVGYQQLIKYKVADGGFEWFGRSPSIPALSAYALLQFTEMSKVTQQLVDPNIISGLRVYLASSKDGKGGFLFSNKSLDSFGNAPYNITNAYILWSLARTNLTQNYTNEIS